MSIRCASCGTEGEGRFCAECGTPLEPARCASCDHEPPAGARFCNECGTPLAEPAAAPAAGPVPVATGETAEPQRGDATLAWWVAGAALVALIAVILVPRFGAEREANPLGPQAEGIQMAPAAGAALGDARSVDLASMTPREAADRLFNRVMQNVSAGDTATARQFLPMALGAYERVEELDLDGRYHLAVLHLVGNDAAAARAEAQRILDAEPDHLFGLFTAAQAEQAQGDADAAREFYQRFLDRFDEQTTRTDLREYQEHQQMLPIMREEAERRAGGAN